MKQEKNKRPFKAAQSDEDLRVDVRNDAEMVKLGIRVPMLKPRDKHVWTKTFNEKRILRAVKHSCKDDMRFHTIPHKSVPVRAKLIIQLKKNNKYPNTTYSTECQLNEIGLVLSNYIVENKKTGKVDSLVLKYSYNGKTYKPEERPFWY